MKKLFITSLSLFAIVYNTHAFASNININEQTLKNYPIDWETTWHKSDNTLFNSSRNDYEIIIHVTHGSIFIEPLGNTVCDRVKATTTQDTVCRVPGDEGASALWFGANDDHIKNSYGYFMVKEAKK